MKEFMEDTVFEFVPFVLFFIIRTATAAIIVALLVWGGAHLILLIFPMATSLAAITLLRALIAGLVIGFILSLLDLITS